MASKMWSQLGEDNVDSSRLFTRRAFIRRSSVSVAGSALVANVGFRLARAEEGSEKPLVRIGLLTALHFADKPPAGTRHYRETMQKLAEAAQVFEQEQVDLVVTLGDLIDSADSLDVEQNHLRRITAEFTAREQNRLVRRN